MFGFQMTEGKSKGKWTIWFTDTIDGNGNAGGRSRRIERVRTIHYFWTGEKFSTKQDDAMPFDDADAANDYKIMNADRLENCAFK